MGGVRISKRLIDGLMPTGREFFVWDDDLPGFGVRVRASGAMSYVLQYRAGSGRGAPARRMTLGMIGKVTADQARELARRAFGEVAAGRDPAAEKSRQRLSLTFAALGSRFLTDHMEVHRKPSTVFAARWHIQTLLGPELGSRKAIVITRADLAKAHRKIGLTMPTTANRVLATVSSMYSFAQKENLVPEGYNPATGIEKFQENRRERYLTTEELQRLGSALRQAEAVGLPWRVSEDGPNSKHLVSADRRLTLIDPFAIAAIRLLILTGCRMREILHAKWTSVDFERGLLFLEDSKTGKKTVILNAPALAVLEGLPRTSAFIIPGLRPTQPRSDLKRPWRLISSHADLLGVRIHDLRHSFASIGVGGGLGLPIVGKLLGHVQSRTTERYAHLDADPLRRASDVIANTLSAALDGQPSVRVIGIPGAK